MLTRAQRNELGDFLRRRRAQLSPADVGLVEYGRRRTPGLRREEVAQLAAISPSWYAWLEQGRDIRVSPPVLAGIARALQLDPDGTDHLFTLAGQVPPRQLDGDDAVLEPLRRLLDVLVGSPAYIIDRCWTILAWNTEAIDLFGAEFESLSAQDRNALLFVVTGAHTPLRFANWREMVPVYLAEFRIDATRHLGDAAFDALIERLDATSPVFRELWTRHEVGRHPWGPAAYVHPVVGRLQFDFVSLQTGASPDFRMHVYVPVSGSGTEQALAQLRVLRSAT